MTRALRILQSTSNATVAAAPPPEAVSLESDFVVILAALLCALICVVGLIAAARCACLRRGSGAGGIPRRAPANKGLNKRVLQALPKFAYVDGNPTKWMASPECAICLAEFAEGDEIRVLPRCLHGFHVGCIDRWLGSHSSCPSCRQILAVPRCQKCGQYPAVGGDGGARITVGGAELKSAEEDSGKDNGNGNAAATSDVGANMSHHIYIHSHNVNNGFLP